MKTSAVGSVPLLLLLQTLNMRRCRRGRRGDGRRPRHFSDPSVVRPVHVIAAILPLVAGDDGVGRVALRKTRLHGRCRGRENRNENGGSGTKGQAV